MQYQHQVWPCNTSQHSLPPGLAQSQTTSSASPADTAIDHGPGLSAARSLRLPKIQFSAKYVNSTNEQRNTPG